MKRIEIVVSTALLTTPLYYYNYDSMSMLLFLSLYTSFTALYITSLYIR